MAAVAFDPLEYTHQLEASGVPREQAEVHAKAMTAMFLHNFDALVTKDYLDSRFNEFETRVEATMDKRFAEWEPTVDKRFLELESRMEKRFVEFESRMDQRFADAESAVNQRFTEVDLWLELMDGRFNLVYWMQGITIACVVISVIRDFLS